METERLSAHLLVLRGAVNTGVLTSGDHALLIDCCDSVTPQVLASLGVAHVDMILCTQHRRPNVAGAYPFVAKGARLVAPAAESHLFDGVDAYWNDWQNRWFVYHQQPSTQVLAEPLPVHRAVADGDAIDWEGHTIRVLETPGATDSSLSYLVSTGGKHVCFCGDVLCGPGQVWDLYSLQKGFGVIGDYHGFLGNRPKLAHSLRRLSTSGVDVLVPSHGPVIDDPGPAIDLARERLEALWRNYCSVSALNHYFPHLLDETKDNPDRMTPAVTLDMPVFVRKLAYTSFAVISESGAALVIDCGHDTVVDRLQQWIRRDTITSVDGCWVTHYHNDHVDALPRLAQAFGCPIIADRSLAEVIAHPSRFFLPCISPNAAPAVRATGDGESWQWHEFRLTAFHFPGQTLYHGGLLVDGRGTSVLFVGDSFAPTGLDDYCAGNRNFLRRGQGLRRCLDLIRQRRPDYLVNQHQERAFRFTEEQLDYLEQTLARREALLAEVLPWPHPDFGTDEWWVRTYPYQQEAAAGATIAVDVWFTNHAPVSMTAVVEPVLPPGWTCELALSVAEAEVPAKSSGLPFASHAPADGSARQWIRVPTAAAPGRYVVPFRVTWGGRYLSQIRHCLIDVRP